MILGQSFSSCSGILYVVLFCKTDSLFSETKNLIQLVWGESEELLLIDICLSVCVCVRARVREVVDILSGAASGPDTADIPHPSWISSLEVLPQTWLSGRHSCPHGTFLELQPTILQAHSWNPLHHPLGVYFAAHYQHLQLHKIIL